MLDPIFSAGVVCAVLLIVMFLGVLSHRRRRPRPLTTWMISHLYALRLGLWHRCVQWPRPLVYKLLILVCLTGALVECLVIVLLPSPDVGATHASGLQPTPLATPPPVATVLLPTLTPWPTPPPTPQSTTGAGVIFSSPGSVRSTVLPSATPGAISPTPVSRPPLPSLPGLAMLSVRFIAEPNDGVVPLVAFIAAAHNTLDGEIYLLSDPAIERAFSDAVVRGVRVRLIIEQHPYGGDKGSAQGAYQYLTGHGVQVQWGSPAFRFTHAKNLIADGTQAWIGTMNWTPAAFSRNRDFAAIVNDPNLLRATAALFAADWAHLPGTTLAPGLVISPLNARHDIMALIENAGYTIDVYAEEITDRQVVQDLIAAERRGVHVRIVYTGIGNLGALAQAGAQVQRVTYPHYIHAKAIVVDGNRMFVGSENLSATSLDKNREVGLVLRDRLAISLVEQPFAADLQRGHAQLPPIAVPTAGPAATPLPGFRVQDWVTPGRMPYDAYPVLSARSLPGAVCSADVEYSTGYAPVSFSGIPQIVGPDGTVRWGWHEMTKGDSGDVTVSCTYRGAVQNAATHFTITR